LWVSRAYLGESSNMVKSPAGGMKGLYCGFFYRKCG